MKELNFSPSLPFITSKQIITISIFVFLFGFIGCESKQNKIQYNPNCSCWKVKSWQQDPQTTIIGNVPNLEPATCFLSYADRVWTQGYIGNTTTYLYWISLEKNDPFISFTSGVYKFAPHLVFENPHSGSNPPRFRVDAIACTGCPNNQPTMDGCPCPDYKHGCAVQKDDTPLDN